MSLGLRIKEIIFKGNKKKSLVSFDNPVCFVHGASNTGKSLLVEAIDYMLGKGDLRKVLPQSEGYDELAMKVTLDGDDFTLFRRWPSIDFEVYHGHIDSKDNANFLSYYRQTSPTKKIPSINEFYFRNLERPELLRNLYGEKTSLTIRLLSRIIISGEEKIIRTDSPIIVGDSNENSKNKYVFRYLLTGKDDSEVKTLTRGGEFNSERNGRKSVLEDVVDALKLDLNFPDENTESLDNRVQKLEAAISKGLAKLEDSQKSLSGVISEKKSTAETLMKTAERANVIAANLANFDTLKKLYLSDIERLSSQEEAAFLLSVGHYGQCLVCGNTIDTACDDLSNINHLAEASKAEIQKIKSKYHELQDTTKALQYQLDDLESKAVNLKIQLKQIDYEVERCTPVINSNDNQLAELRKERAAIQFDRKLHDRIRSFTKKLQEIELASTPKQYKSEEFLLETDAINGFCKIYSSILSAIKFPGEHHVDFDFQKFDVIIDGTPRDLNGKGVRAILHSVFKISLLIHCRENNIYHPGIVILDSPLVTYRDPLTSKHGELGKDEEQLAKTKISYHFLNYLYQIRHLGQFIIVENIDIPETLRNVIGVETFYGQSATTTQRVGLL
ncbi:coiled-coil domain-containing protein [Vibrio pomeroyi]|uniref:coiled-coil domain-containing protein n=1 Tax=Vibrio pomeroyi TaxID=198832 RepID=UPI0021C49269|nr:hypothetical protein [Vibrio pomeroyi]